MTILNIKDTFVQPTMPERIAVPFVAPLTYEFRVAETVGDDGKVVKVGLQTRISEHDEFGVGTVIQHWTDVSRVILDKSGNLITK